METLRGRSVRFFSVTVQTSTGCLRGTKQRCVARSPSQVPLTSVLAAQNLQEKSVTSCGAGAPAGQKTVPLSSSRM